jgi:hypothetical protein
MLLICAPIGLLLWFIHPVVGLLACGAALVKAWTVAASGYRVWSRGLHTCQMCGYAWHTGAGSSALEGTRAPFKVVGVLVLVLFAWAIVTSLAGGGSDDDAPAERYPADDYIPALVASMQQHWGISQGEAALLESNDVNLTFSDGRSWCERAGNIDAAMLATYGSLPTDPNKPAPAVVIGDAATRTMCPEFRAAYEAWMAAD